MRLKRMLQLGCVTGAAVAPAIADEAADTQSKAVEVLRATPTGVAHATPGVPNTSDWQSAYSTARDQREQQLKGEADSRRGTRDRIQSEKRAANDIAAKQRQSSMRRAAWEVSVAQRAAVL